MGMFEKTSYEQTGLARIVVNELMYRPIFYLFIFGLSVLSACPHKKKGSAGLKLRLEKRAVAMLYTF